MKEHYDVIVIGAGPAGTSAAFELANSKSVLVVENDLFGGTCPNRGCDPKKMLYSAVEAKSWVERMQDSGLQGNTKINWSKLMAFKRSYTKTVPEKTKLGLKNAGIDSYQGQVSFKDEHTLIVDETEVIADKFVIATGRRPMIPDMAGKESLHTSTDFLDLDELPQKITFIGAGLVSMELANIANQAGAQVEIIHHNNRPLKQFPTKMVQTLIEQMKNNGVIFHLNANVKSIVKSSDNFNINTDIGDFTSNYVIAGTGRQANIDNLNLENCHVKSNQKGILVDEYLRTTNSNIYAIGDVVAKAKPKLTPVASFEGRYLGQLLAGKTTNPIEYPLIPELMFGTTEIGQMGIDEATALSDPQKYQLSELDLSSWYTYNRVRDTDANAIIIREIVSQRIVGFSMMSSLTEEVMNYMNFALSKKMTNEEIKKMIFAYPSAASDLQYLV